MKYSIDSINNEFQNGFKCQANKTKALKQLNNLYHIQKELIMKGILQRRPEDDHEYNTWNDLYWSIPHDLHQWQAKHSNSLPGFDLDDTVNQINQLKHLRTAIKDSEILPIQKSELQTRTETIEKSIQEIIKAKREQYISGLSLAHLFNGLNVSVNSHYVTNQYQHTFIRSFYYLNGKMTALQMIIAIAEQFKIDQEIQNV